MSVPVSLGLMDFHATLGRLVLLAKQVDALGVAVYVEVDEHAVAAVILPAKNGLGQLKGRIIRGQVPEGAQQHPAFVRFPVMQAQQVLLFIELDAVGLFALVVRGRVTPDPDAAGGRQPHVLRAVKDVDDGGDILLLGLDGAAVLGGDIDAGMGFLPGDGGHDRLDFVDALFILAHHFGGIGDLFRTGSGEAQKERQEQQRGCPSSETINPYAHLYPLPYTSHSVKAGKAEGSSLF